AHTPFVDRMSAPRQPAAAEGVKGTIELYPGRDFEHALEDLEGWDFIWVIFWFHLNEGWRPKVLPPRSTKRRGVFSTRSPHRPNPLGLSVLKLERVEGLILHVANLDILDGTPVLDIKPYVAYADALPDAKEGWLERDPEAGYEVVWSPRAEEQAAWLLAHGIDVKTSAESTLTIGPQPHPYRRIKPDGDALRLAVKEWRVRFRVDARTVTVSEIVTGYRKSQLETRQAGEAPSLEVHRAFVSKYP
ncbi:MAG: tRNA (N6-threonylcarbamoyladenosine(37)-N6)-methyltransferase TrmO, partial [Polyangiaceae bacterium]